MAIKKTSLPPAPKAVGDTVNFTAFTAANPSVGTAEDASALVQGDTLTLAAVAGDPAAMAAIDGVSVEVGAITGTDVSLVNLDLSAVDVTGLAGTGTVSATAPAPSPSPPPSPSPSPPPSPEDVVKLALQSTPSPGVGSLPVPPNPDDTFPGTSSPDDPIPNPDNPTGPPLKDADAQKLRDKWQADRQAALDVIGETVPPPTKAGTLPANVMQAPPNPPESY